MPLSNPFKETQLNIADPDSKQDLCAKDCSGIHSRNTVGVEEIIMYTSMFVCVGGERDPRLFPNLRICNPKEKI